MNFADINGVETCYYSAGHTGPDVLFLHGWGSSARMWLRSMWALRREYRLWAIDLPGFGYSDTPDIDWYTIENYTRHVYAFCEHVDIQPYALVGHSMGGRVIFDFALRYPQMADRLVGISPSISGRLSFNLDLLLMGNMGRRLMDITKYIWPVAMANVMTQYWAPRYIGSEGVKRTTEDLRRSSWEGSVGSARALVTQNILPDLENVQHPTLLICGKKDFTIPPEDSSEAMEKLPNGQFLLLDRVHHQPTDEAPDTYMKALRDFLEAVPVGAE